MNFYYRRSFKKEKQFTIQLKDIIQKERQMQTEISEKEKIAIFDLEVTIDQITIQSIISNHKIYFEN